MDQMKKNNNKNKNNDINNKLNNRNHIHGIYPVYLFILHVISYAVSRLVDKGLPITSSLGAESIFHGGNYVLYGVVCVDLL